MQIIALLTKEDFLKMEFIMELLVLQEKVKYGILLNSLFINHNFVLKLLCFKEMLKCAT